MALTHSQLHMYVYEKKAMKDVKPVPLKKLPKANPRGEKIMICISKSTYAIPCPKVLCSFGMHEWKGK